MEAGLSTFERQSYDIHAAIPRIEAPVLLNEQRSNAMLLGERYYLRFIHVLFMCRTLYASPAQRASLFSTLDNRSCASSGIP
jgi:hypothetical protein